MRGSRTFRQGGGGLTKKALTFFFVFFFCFFFSPQLLLQKSNGQYQRNLSFFKVPEGVQHFSGGSNFFQGGSNCLFPIETHITCDFPGGGGIRTPCPPPPTSGSALAPDGIIWIGACIFTSVLVMFFEHNKLCV